MNNDIKIGSVSAGTVSRVLILLISIFNEAAVSFGWYQINVSDDQVVTAVSFIFMVAMALWCAWKNNPMTKAAIQANEVMKADKAGKDVQVIISDPKEGE